MNYIVFINKNGSEKLAISTNVKYYYEITVRLANIIKLLCNANNYDYKLTDTVNKKNTHNRRKIVSYVKIMKVS